MTSVIGGAVWEIFYCKSAYEGLLEVQICHMVTEQGLRPEFDDTCPLPYQELAQACWHHSPANRCAEGMLVTLA